MYLYDSNKACFAQGCHCSFLGRNFRTWRNFLSGFFGTVLVGLTVPPEMILCAFSLKFALALALVALFASPTALASKDGSNIVVRDHLRTAAPGSGISSSLGHNSLVDPGLSLPRLSTRLSLHAEATVDISKTGDNSRSISSLYVESATRNTPYYRKERFTN